VSAADTETVIARALTAFKAGDIDGVAACLAEDVAVDLPGTPREIGLDKARWRLADLSRFLRAEAMDIAIMTDRGGVRAALEFTLSGTYLATLPGFPEARGQTFRLPAGLFLDIDDEDLISRVTICCDPARLSASLQEE